jgi:D-psicose/D-tagatose/L-ribulose 3-epimerase
MRFGVCIGFTDIEAIAGLARIGYDYIELPLAQVMDLAEADFETLVERLEGTGVRSEAMNLFFPRRIRLTGEEVDPPAIQAYVRSAVGRAKRLGARVVVLGSSGSRNVPEGFPREKAWSQLVDALRRIDPLVGEAGMTVALEPLNRKEGNILNTLEEAHRLSREADCPNIQVLVEYYHFSLEQEPLDHILAAGCCLRHVHLAKVAGRVYPTEMDEGYQAFFRALKAASYAGRVSIEAGTSDLLNDARMARDVLLRLTG